MSELADAEAAGHAASAAQAEPMAEPLALGPPEAVEGWSGIKRELSALLLEGQPDARWFEALEALTLRMRTLARRDFDAALYLLLQDAAHGECPYSAHHALLCALVCEVCADWFELPASEIDAVVRAALTMNLSMAAVQDALAQQDEPPSDEQRGQIEGHAQRSAAMLAEGGLSDALCVEVVRRHHDARDTGTDAAQRLAHLLRRVDQYTAKLSRRASRDAVSPAIAARDTCLDADGKPDTVGMAMLRKLGLYPPGSFVRLANGDLGVVVRRGALAHTPIVAALRRDDGGAHLHPRRCDTARRELAVVHGVTAEDVRVRLNHLRNLALA
jgi:hypothetical protein